MILKIRKKTNPSTDAKSKKMNFLVVRHGWENARIKATAANKARRMPGGLSSILFLFVCQLDHILVVHCSASVLASLPAFGR